MRLFVALSLPDSIRSCVGHLCGGLRGIRWRPMENFHITLRFLGEIDGRDMDYVDAALAGIRMPRFELSVKGVGIFSSGTKIKTIYAGIERSQALQHLHDKVESAVVRAGLEAEGKKFTPHITLAYPKESPPWGSVNDYLAENSLFRTPPFEVTHFTLFSSFMGGEASTYRAERSYALVTRPLEGIRVGA